MLQPHQLQQKAGRTIILAIRLIRWPATVPLYLSNYLLAGWGWKSRVVGHCHGMWPGPERNYGTQGGGSPDTERIFTLSQFGEEVSCETRTQQFLAFIWLQSFAASTSSCQHEGSLRWAFWWLQYMQLQLFISKAITGIMIYNTLVSMAFKKIVEGL